MTEKKRIYVTYGRDIGRMTLSLAAHYPFEERLPDKDALIGIKPNLVIAATPDTGATTHMEIIHALIEHLQNLGYKNITILEGSWVGEDTKRAFRLNGYIDTARKYSVGLLDIKDDRYVERESHGIRMEISETASKLDFLINLPVLKGHCQTGMTCALKNMKGCLSDRSKRMFHAMGLMRPIAALNTVLRPDLTIVDGICGDLDFEEGGNPVEMNRMMMSEDPVLIDAYSAALLGFSLEDVSYIPLAEAFGAGSTDWRGAEILEIGKPADAIGVRPTGEAGRLSRYVAAESACSACQANLIHALKRLDGAGLLHKLGTNRIAIGQGFRNKACAIGAGECCKMAIHHAGGCPVKAEDVVEMVRNL